MPWEEPLVGQQCQVKTWQERVLEKVVEEAITSSNEVSILLKTVPSEF